MEDEFITSFRKEFGEDSIFLLGEDERLSDIKVRSSGSLLLDLALGGGFAQGRLALLQGPEKSGKCITSDTRILTINGYKTLGEMFKERGVELNNSLKDVVVDYPLINRYGDVENTSHFVVNGKRKVARVTTKSGLRQKATMHHPLLVLDTGLFVWKRVRDLRVGDILVTRKGDKIGSPSYLISKKEAYLLGLLVADGCFLKQRVSFTNDNPEIKAFFEGNYRCLRGFEDIDLKMYDNNGKGSVNYCINTTEGAKVFYNYYGLSEGTAANKIIPNCVKYSSIEIQREFLRGYIECEAWVGQDRSCIEIISASYRLISEVQLMLRNLGILGNLSDKQVKGYEDNSYFRLTIYGDSVKLLIRELGEFTEEVQLKLNNLSGDILNSSTIYGINDLVVAYYNSLPMGDRNRENQVLVYDLTGGKCECTKSRLVEMLKFNGDNNLKEILLKLTDPNLEFEPIVSIEACGYELTFDICMPVTHSFVAEGIINHNTSVACLAIAEAQQNEPDKNVAIIDLEHSFNPDWAQKLGVDIDNLMILQPDTYAEKVYDMLEYMIKSEKFSIIVLDSLDGLVPKDELEEGDWSKESRVGGTAKLNSKAMRKLINSGLLSKSGTTLIFIQQLRDKVGGFAMYGIPTTTSGGRSIKHASTQTLEVAIGDFFTKGAGIDKKFFGQQIRVKVAKNKIAPPFRQATIDIYYEHGMDRIDETVIVAKELGILQGTNWLKLIDINTGEPLKDDNGNEYRWNGIAKTKEALIEDIKSNNGEIYSIIFDSIQQTMRG